MLLTRRSLFKGLGLLIAAPAIVKAENLMKVKSVAEQEKEIVDLLTTTSVGGSRYWLGPGTVHFADPVGWTSAMIPVELPHA